MKYLIVGETIEGDKLMSPAKFTHAIPDGPVMISPEGGVVVDLDAAIITWESVNSPAGIEIVRYELFVAPAANPDEWDPPPVLDVDLTLELPSTVTEVSIPPELLMPGTGYAFEVLAIEVSGNKTITAGEFVTAAD